MTWYHLRFTKKVHSGGGSWFGSGRSRSNIRKPLRLEFLEGRCVPSTITPTTFADGGLRSGSLRDAVLQFNADSGSDDDIIQLLAGTYRLTIQNPGGVHETAGLTGDLNLTQTSHRWIIQGAGPSTIIDASQLQDRVFQVVNPGVQVVFQDLVIQGGLAQDNGANGAVAGQSDALGGGLLNNGGNVTLNHVVVQNNRAQGGDARALSTPGYNASGGGIYSSGGALTLAGATLANNQVLGGRGGNHNRPVYPGNGGAGSGGGLYATGGSLDISDSTIGSNHATGGPGGDGFSTREMTHSGGYTTRYYGGTGGAGQGGGLYVSGSALTLATSTLANNRATGGDAGLYGQFGNSYGGGLDNAGTLTVSNSTLSGNSALSYSYYAYGGGIYNDYFGGTLTVSNSTLSGNSANIGGGIFNWRTLTVSTSTLFGNTAFYYGGAIYNDVGATLTVSTSTLSGNSAGSGGGGGIYNWGTLTVSNSTLSGNTSFYIGGGIVTLGTLTVTLTNVTLTANRAYSGGGGLFVVGSPILHNTLIAGNFQGVTGTTADDVRGALASRGDYNLIGDGTGMTGLVNGVNGNLIGSAAAPIDPLLGPLQDNGGPTFTHALLAGSPAIDAGNNAYATDWDQRGPGFPRIVNGIIDIGAFENQGAGSGPSTPRASRRQQDRLAQLVAGLPPAVSHPVAQSPALSQGQTSPITRAGPLLRPWEAASDLAVASVDSYYATVFEDRGRQTTLPWSDLELAAI